jgi:hypothetical protein
MPIVFLFRLTDVAAVVCQGLSQIQGVMQHLLSLYTLQGPNLATIICHHPPHLQAVRATVMGFHWNQCSPQIQWKMMLRLAFRMWMMTKMMAMSFMLNKKQLRTKLLPFFLAAIESATQNFCCWTSTAFPYFLY